MVAYAIIKQKRRAHMELLQLKYFTEAAKNENLSATAKKFMVPPSAVSQSIKRLEKEMGCDLFIRQANRIHLSPKGGIFYEKVSKGLQLLNDAKEELTDEGTHGTVKLSIFINRRLVMQTVEKFSRQYPEINIVTKYTAAPTEDDFDLIITDKMPHEEAYSAVKLLEESILLAVHRENPLAKATVITAQALSQVPFICTNQSSSLSDITENICTRLGFSPHVAIRSDDPYYIRKCVELGLGATFVPTLSWQGQFSENVVLKKVTDDTRTTYAYRNRQKYFSRPAALFLKMLEEEFSAPLLF